MHVPTGYRLSFIKDSNLNARSYLASRRISAEVGPVTHNFRYLINNNKAKVIMTYNQYDMGRMGEGPALVLI